MSFEQKLEKPPTELQSVIDYLSKKHESLRNNYRTSDNAGADSCLLNAIDVAKLLKDHKKHPYLLSIRGRLLDSVNTDTLCPKMYNGAVKWGAHIVCVVDTTVYDPMIGHPMDLQEYLDNTFEELPTHRIFKTVEETEQFIK